MSDGFHAADDGSLARSTGGAAARGAMLIALAIVIGLLLLTFALNDSSSEVVVDETEQTNEDNEDGNADGAAVDAVDPPDEDAEAEAEAEADATIGADDEAESIPEETIEATDEDRSPSEINVIVANGVGTAGIAGATADVLIADGYIGVPADAPDTVESVILYKDGYDADALAIAAILGAPADVVQPVAADGSLPIDQDAIDDGRGEMANVIVILGSDGVVPPG